MRLSAKQWQAYRLLQDRSKTKVLLEGGARSGKTFLICVWIVAVCESFPDVAVGVFRKFRRSCASSVVKSFQGILAGRRGWEFSKSDLSFSYANGSQISFYGTSDDNGERLLGLELAIAWCNEVTEMEESSVQTVLSRLSSNATPIRRLIADTNPKSSGHWCRRYWKLKQAEDGTPFADADSIASMVFLPQDNPFLPQQTLEVLKNLTGVARDRLWKGLWQDNEGLVFDEFDLDKHLFAEIPEVSEIVCSCDFGYTAPFAFLWGFKDGDGDLWICGEHYKAGMLVREHAQIIKEITKGKKIRVFVCDSEDAESRKQLEREGLPNAGTDKKALSVFDGIMRMKEYLKIRPNGKPRLHIHKSCKNLIREMQNLKWRKGEDKPEDGNDHAIDSARYLLQYLSKPVYSGGGGIAKR